MLSLYTVFSNYFFSQSQMLLLTPTVIHELKIYSHMQFLYGKQK